MGLSLKSFARITAILSVFATTFVSPTASAKSLPACTQGNASASEYTAFGAGTVANPYEIWTAEQIWQLAHSPAGWTGQFEQCADINFSGFYSDSRPYFTIGGSVASPNSMKFRGTYDGRKHSIKNFRYDVEGEHYSSEDVLALDGVTVLRNSEESLGLFAVMGSGSVVKNLNIERGYIVSGDRWAGLVAGQLDGGTISAVRVSGVVKRPGSFGTGMSQNSTAATGFGGVAGFVRNGALVENARVFVDVHGNGQLGGVAGLSTHWGPAPAFRNILVKGNVSGVINSRVVGGFIGRSKSATITNVESHATVTGAFGVGGLIGVAADTDISHSRATGDVNYIFSASTTLGGTGGLIGSASKNVHVSWSVASGNVRGDQYVGGFVGDSSADNTFTNCYASGDVTAIRTTIGGFVGKTKAWSNYASDRPMILNSYASGDVLGHGTGGTFFGDAPTNYVSLPVANNSFATGEAPGGALFGNGGVNATMVWYNSDVMPASFTSASAASMNAGHFWNPNASLGLEWATGYAKWSFGKGRLPTIPAAGASF